MPGCFFALARFSLMHPARGDLHIALGDFFRDGAVAFAQNTDQSVGKETGRAVHVERWNNALRQRLARLVRKTLSFSKSDEFHEIALKLLIFQYNVDCVK